MNMLMKQNDFNHLATLLTANEGAIIKFSEEDIRYLSDETEAESTSECNITKKFLKKTSFGVKN